MTPYKIIWSHSEVREYMSVSGIQYFLALNQWVLYFLCSTVSFSLNLSLLPVHSLSESEGSGKFFGFRHISIDRQQPCSAVASHSAQDATINLFNR